jgi:hypothetical protein
MNPRTALRGLAAAMLTPGLTACTAESTRAALAAQQRADGIQQAIFERQHDGLRLLLYRDALRRLEAADTTQQRAAVLNEVWNERDLIEFWAIQNERCAALRLMGVDFKLYADQSILDLLLRQMEARWQRVEEGLAASAGIRAAKALGPGGDEERAE